MKKIQRGAPRKRKIRFEELFDKTLKEKAKNFLESGTPTATITKAILLTAALGGVLAVGIMAPNLFRAFPMNRESRRSRLSEKGFYHLRRSTYQLRKKGLIAQSGKDGLWHITEEGLAALRNFLGITGKEIFPPRRWDRKVRLVIFDIPDEKRIARNAFRKGLREMGFFQFQKSVLAHPFPCKKEVIDLATQLGIYDYVEICTVEDLYNTRLQSFFMPLLKNIPRIS